MKRVIPEEIIKARFWLLSQKRFDEANAMADIISCMESGIKLGTDRAKLFGQILKDYKDFISPKKQDKRAQALEYFTQKYGRRNADIIMRKLEAGVSRYSLEGLIDMGDKIALFNGWTNL